MDLHNFVRGFFGFRHPKPDDFGDCSPDNAKCQHPESCEKRPSSPGDTVFHDDDFFNIVQPLDPFSIFRQMEEVFSNFFSFRSGGMLDFPSSEEPRYDGNENYHDFFVNPSERNFRELLWEESDHNGSSEFSSIESFPRNKSPRDHVLKPSYKDSGHLVQPAPLQDSDLDDAVLNNERGHSILKQFSQEPKKDVNWSFRKSVSIRTIRGPDGTVEEHRTVRDSSGNEVTTVRQSIGDQSYSVTLHKDSEGLKEKKEDLINLDEKDIPTFKEKWSNMEDNIFRAPQKDLFDNSDPSVRNLPGDPHYSSIFKNIFRF